MSVCPSMKTELNKFMNLNVLKIFRFIVFALRPKHTDIGHL